MATATQPTLKPRSRKPAPPDVCRLTLTIRGVSYAVRFLPVDPASGVTRLVRLRKADGEAYHVAMTEHGPVCDCAAATFRDEFCKHSRSLQAFGLI